jgi:hypothetical protein
MRHRNCADNHRHAIEKISKRNCGAKNKQDRDDNHADKTGHGRDVIFSVRSWRMYPQMKQPAAQS